MFHTLPFPDDKILFLSNKLSKSSKISYLYSGRACSNLDCGKDYPDRRLIVFLSPSCQMTRLCLKLCHDHALPYHFQFIIHYHPIQLQTELLNKLQIK